MGDFTARSTINVSPADESAADLTGNHEEAPASGTRLPGWTEGAFLSSPLLAESGYSWDHVSDHVSDHVAHVSDHRDGDVITRLESNAGEVSARQACL